MSKLFAVHTKELSTYPVAHRDNGLQTIDSGSDQVTLIEQKQGRQCYLDPSLSISSIRIKGLNVFVDLTA